MNGMLFNIFAYVLGAIVAIPVLLWFAVRKMFSGGWRLLGFVCQRQYRKLRHLCEHGTADDLNAFLKTHPGARKYVVYARQDKATSLVTSFFRLPAPLAVASEANNLAVIPVLLANGAEPGVRSISAAHSPAEEAIGAPDRMRVLCGGKTWWRESSAGPEALAAELKAGNVRGIIWNVMRGARLEKPELLHSLPFVNLTMPLKEFVCRFGVDESRRTAFQQWLDDNPVTRQDVKKTFYRLVAGMGPVVEERLKGFAAVPVAMTKAMQPLPTVADDAVERLACSAILLERSNMQTLLDVLFSQEQQFSILRRCMDTPPSANNREMVEETVDLLLCSLLAKAKK